ncbi:hypothetical protein OBBRIDRAFT_518138 [Obba rivulosa]|uniref:Uncharacterized protein n=1 Tax=Obba rivulosa TaxID=1052685 RepID=A0A8E2B4N8_9APHY|nr:hypothetical protein OBBRIDRAFT_518138 [Obba rivulosa]
MPDDSLALRACCTTWYGRRVRGYPTAVFRRSLDCSQPWEMSRGRAAHGPVASSLLKPLLASVAVMGAELHGTYRCHPAMYTQELAAAKRDTGACVCPLAHFAARRKCNMRCTLRSSILLWRCRLVEFFLTLCSLRAYFQRLLVRISRDALDCPFSSELRLTMGKELRSLVRSTAEHSFALHTFGLSVSLPYLMSHSSLRSVGQRVLLCLHCLGTCFDVLHVCSLGCVRQVLALVANECLSLKYEQK